LANYGKVFDNKYTREVVRCRYDNDADYEHQCCDA
jgi:hypothetical protein